MSVAKRYSTPKSLTSETMTIASAPVAQDIIPGLPQNTAVMSHTINAACNQIIGLISATNENAIASGTSAKATVRPERISVFSCLGFVNSFLISMIQKKCNMESNIVIIYKNILIKKLSVFI
jgi:hypothetical protein